MADLIPWIAFAAILVAWLALVIFIKRRKVLADKGVSVYGPFLMWRTEGGKRFIERISKPARFWKAYALAAKVICLSVAVFIMALLIWEATIVSRVPDSSAPTPEMMLGIPGINPIIPVVFGIIGLIVAIVVHEFAHGVLTRVGRMNIKSLGLFLFIVPLGAFVEPDEKQISTSDRKRRSDIYAVGPATNIILAVLCVMLFCGAFMSSVEPVRANPVITAVGDNSPAYYAGIGYGSQLVDIEGTPIQSLDDFDNILVDPGTYATVSYYLSGELKSSEVTAGLTLVDVSEGLPAEEAGLEAGMIVAELNGTVIRNQADLQAALDLTHPDQVVSIRALVYDEGAKGYVVSSVTSITLESKREYYLRQDPSLVNESFKDIGFMGVNSAYMGFSMSSPESIVQRLASPLAGVNDPISFFGSSLLFIALPFQGLAPVESPLTDLFVPTGLMADVPADLFWFLANCLYWIFWINLMVGMTNVLPAVPLDGGYLFRDTMEWLIEKFKKNASEKERAHIVSTVTYVLALFVFMLIIWQLIGPRLL
jgi:membrane-associated protease RseP (regulator of RpoE activity)